MYLSVRLSCVVPVLLFLVVCPFLPMLYSSLAAVLTAGANINGTCAEAHITNANSTECKNWEKDIVASGPVWFELQKDLR